MQKKKICKAVAISILFILIAVSVVDAIALKQKHIVEPINRGPSTYTWEDDFFNMSKIDTDLSFNYVISNGNITMDNTYEAWYAYPKWERMKPIIITNSGSEINDYILEIIVEYDSEMLSNFNDIRFTNETGYPLVYNKLDYISGVSANVFLKIPIIPTGALTIYMFYGNPSAGDESSDVFTWSRTSGPGDIDVSYTVSEGCWDPDVSYGNGNFLVGWEEGIPPEYLPSHGHRIFHREIHGRLYDTNGGNPNPPPSTADLIISTESASYHSENPSIAYGSSNDRFFVVWEQNPIISRLRIGIHGAIVRRSDGLVYSPSTIDDPEYSFPQYYPCLDPSVAYDDQSDRFLVTWAKSSTSWNFDIYGRLFDYNGNPIGSAFQIVSGSYYQGQPALCSDNLGRFMLVYEEGNDPETGPFSIKGMLLDSSGSQIGSTKTIASGTSEKDCIYPSISYSSQTEKYLVVWNTGDVSSGDYTGEINGRILDQNGDPQGSTIVIRYSISREIADVVPYHDTMFFVSYDNGNGIWGRLVSSDGELIEGEFYLCDSESDGADYNSLAVSNGNIFSSWEDERYLGAPPTAICGNVINCDQTIGLSEIDYSFGDEEELIVDAVITSVPIIPENFQSWDEFTADFIIPSGTSIRFDIINQTTYEIIKEEISSGEDISDIIDPYFRLKATFSRDTPQYTPSLDRWGVTAEVGGDLEAPWTTCEFDPASPDGNNGWYVSPIMITLTAHDNDTASENVTTYYKINNEDVVEYTSSFELSTERSDNTVEYWSTDIAENEELPHNIVENIKIDLTSPFITINEPSDLVAPGLVTINGTVTEYASGSGIDQITIRLNDEIIFDESYNGESFIWIDWQFTAYLGETYDLHVKVWDKAGLDEENRITVLCSDRGIYEIGYLYLFDNPKIPISLLEVFDLAVAIDYESLHIMLPEYHENATSIKFIAQQIRLGNQKTVWDDDLSDGCTIDLTIPPGFYQINAYAYDEEDTLLEEYVIISQMLVILLPG